MRSETVELQARDRRERAEKQSGWRRPPRCCSQGRVSCHAQRPMPFTSIAGLTHNETGDQRAGGSRSGREKTSGGGKGD